MENKYYTPKLEEFHIGFEYEVKIPEDKLWSKEIFYLNNSHIDLIQYVDIQDEFTKNAIRIKYLDKEDIENLGFELQKDDSFTKLDDKRDCCWIITYIAYNGIIKDIEVSQEFGSYPLITFFNGTIKNKSELKQILKMIGAE